MPHTFIQKKIDRLMKEFFKKGGIGVRDLCHDGDSVELLESLIEKTLTSALLERDQMILEEIERIKRDVEYKETTDISKALKNGSEAFGYNQALEHIANFIRLSSETKNNNK